MRDGTEGVCSSRSSVVAVLVSDQIHHSKRIKRSSSSIAATRPSLILMNNTSIGDLPEGVLVEILSRLPCYKYVSQCKCVSKHWSRLLSDRSFIGRFLCLQSDKQTEIIRTLINRQGVEFLKRLSSSGKPLTRLFESLMSFYHLKEEPIVVGTYNDLILCCASNVYQRDYYICNAHTNQWVPLPPPPQICHFAPVGFICDLPYYQCRKDNDNRDHINLNAEFRYRVVRLINDPEKKLSCELKVHIFSSETGEWSESIVTTPSPVDINAIDYQIYFPCNGVLYWMAHDCDFIVGVDPFMITDKKSTSLLNTSSYGTPPDDSIYQYRCRFIELDQHSWDDTCVLQCVGVNSGRLQMLDHDLETHVLYVVELNEEEISTAAGKFCLDQRVRSYALDWEMVPEDDAVPVYLVFPLGFDPNDDGTVYMHIGENLGIGEIFSYNIHTGECLKIVEKSSLERYKFCPLVLPWVPTPVPRLPEHARLVDSPNSHL